MGKERMSYIAKPFRDIVWRIDEKDQEDRTHLFAGWPFCGNASIMGSF
jgi:hypothetical protein